MRKNPKTISRRSFVEGTGAIAGGLTLLPGSVMGEFGNHAHPRISDPDQVVPGNPRYASLPGKSSLQSADKHPFIAEKLPGYHNKGFATVRIGLCQVFTEEWAIEANIERSLEAIDIAAAQGAEIAVTPECVFHGYADDDSQGKSSTFKDKLFSIAESLDGRHLKLFRDKAKDNEIHIHVGFVEKGEGASIHNTAALISPEGEFVYIYRKVHCRHFESINHWGYFTPGSDFKSAQLQFNNGICKVGTIICFDREIPESLRCIRSLGAELVLCPLATDTTNMAEYKNEADNEMITRVGSTCSELFIAVVNHAGRFNGGSFITGPKGELLCQMNESPGVLTYDVPVGAIPGEFHNEPLGWMGWGYRRPDVYRKYLLHDEG